MSFSFGIQSDEPSSLSSSLIVFIVSLTSQQLSTSSTLHVSVALLDSGANCHIISPALMEYLHLSLSPSKTRIRIQTADKDKYIECNQVVSLGGYVQDMFFSPMVSQSILSVGLLQKNGLHISFPPSSESSSVMGTVAYGVLPPFL